MGDGRWAMGWGNARGLLDAYTRMRAPRGCSRGADARGVRTREYGGRNVTVRGVTCMLTPGRAGIRVSLFGLALPGLTKTPRVKASPTAHLHDGAYPPPVQLQRADEPTSARLDAVHPPRGLRSRDGRRAHSERREPRAGSCSPHHRLVLGRECRARQRLLAWRGRYGASSHCGRREHEERPRLTSRVPSTGAIPMPAVRTPDQTPAAS
jgi:hypothetical protein